MKRSVISILLTICIFLALPLTAMAQADTVAAGICGENVTWTLDSEGTLTISGSGPMADYPYGAVDSELHPWLRYEEDIKSIVIENGVTYIGDCTFNGSTALASVSIPSTVTAIGESAFKGCTSLTSITIPDSVTEVGSSVFSGCTSLSAVTLSRNMTKVGIRMFEYCESLTSITIPGNISTIGSSAFSFCTALTDVTLEAGVAAIDDWAFESCYELRAITLPESITAIGRGGFDNCPALMNIVFTGAAPAIDDMAFTGVTASIYYPANDPTWTAGKRQSYGGNLMWYGVEDPNQVEPSENSGICGAAATWKLENGILTVSGTGEMEYVPWTGLADQIEKVVIENGVTSIAPNAFYEFGNLTSVTLPESLRSIGALAFVGCKNLTAISLPDGITFIGERAFEECDGLYRVDLPANLQSIESRLFFLCDGLTVVTVGDHITKIGEGAFAQCPRLSALTIPAAVTLIEDSAFIYCTSLRNLEFKGPAPTFVGNFIFDSVTATVRYPADLEGWNSSTMSFPSCRLTWVAYCSGRHKSADGTVIQEATCTQIGTMRSVCTVCGVAYTREIPVSDHSYDGGTVTTAPTCIQEGVMTYACTLCGTTKTEPVPTSGHDYADAVPVYDEAARSHSVTCTLCGEAETSVCTFDEGTVLTEATLSRKGTKKYSCTVCGGIYEGAYILRIYGANRYETAFQIADILKGQLGIEKFENIIVASGKDFPDALAGSYLATVKNAPILLVNQYFIDEVEDYIAANLAEGGKVYLLGGENAVPAEMEEALTGYDVTRLAGSNRFATNLLILEEAGVGDDEILICTGWGFADSLAASAVGKPILLVNQTLTAAQKEFLAESDRNFVIIGGNTVVNGDVERGLEAYGTVERLAGANRYETSVLVAQRFFEAPEAAILAYAQNFPDGLCGGPLAYSLGAPMLLIATNRGPAVGEYVRNSGITAGAVLGGTGLIDEATVNNVFSVN